LVAFSTVELAVAKVKKTDIMKALKPSRQMVEPDDCPCLEEKQD